MAILETAVRTAGVPCLVGSSLGGYYATYLVERYAVKAVLLNPAVRPYELLAGAVGPQENFHTHERYELTRDDVDALRRYEIGRIAVPERLLLLVETGDEVLDYRQAAAKYMWRPAGRDRGRRPRLFSDFAEHLPRVLDFALRLRRSGYNPPPRGPSCASLPGRHPHERILRRRRRASRSAPCSPTTTPRCRSRRRTASAPRSRPPACCCASSSRRWRRSWTLRSARGRRHRRRFPVAVLRRGRVRFRGARRANISATRRSRSRRRGCCSAARRADVFLQEGQGALQGRARGRAEGGAGERREEAPAGRAEAGLRRRARRGRAARGVPAADARSCSTRPTRTASSGRRSRAACEQLKLDPRAACSSAAARCLAARLPPGAFPVRAFPAAARRFPPIVPAAAARRTCRWPRRCGRSASTTRRPPRSTMRSRSRALANGNWRSACTSPRRRSASRRVRRSTRSRASGCRRSISRAARSPCCRRRRSPRIRCSTAARRARRCRCTSKSMPALELARPAAAVERVPHRRQPAPRRARARVQRGGAGGRHGRTPLRRGARAAVAARPRARGGARARPTRRTSRSAPTTISTSTDEPRAIVQRQRGSPVDKLVAEMMILRQRRVGRARSRGGHRGGLPRAERRRGAHDAPRPRRTRAGRGAVRVGEFAAAALRRPRQPAPDLALVARRSRPPIAGPAARCCSARCAISSWPTTLRRIPAPHGTLLVPALDLAGAGHRARGHGDPREPGAASTGCRSWCACRRCPSCPPARACGSPCRGIDLSDLAVHFEFAPACGRRASERFETAFEDVRKPLCYKVLLLCTCVGGFCGLRIASVT